MMRAPSLQGECLGSAAGKWILSQTVTDPSGAVVDAIRISGDDPFSYWWLRGLVT